MRPMPLPARLDLQSERVGAPRDLRQSKGNNRTGQRWATIVKGVAGGMVVVG